MKRFHGRIENGCLTGVPSPESHGGIRVLWRGFVANRNELIAEARRRGEVLESPAEGELFAAAFRWWGPDLQKRVLGEYSVVATDGRAAVLTHDALGLRPLFYRPTSDSIEFASHLEDLVLRTGENGIDLAYVADHLLDDQHWGDHTPYRRLHRLPLGRTLHWTEGRLRERRTWDMASIAPVRFSNPGEVEERLRELIREAVLTACRADGPIWGELSGGLDSSTVMCVAAQAGVPLEAISIVFGRSRRADDSRWMREVLDRHPMPWHRIDGDDPLPFSVVPDRFCAEPHFGFVNWGWLSRYEEEVKADVVLTGLGGDQVFAGDHPTPHFLADHLLRPHRLRRELERWRTQDRAERSQLHWLLQAVVRPSIDFLTGRRLRHEGAPPAPDWVRPDFLRAHRGSRSGPQVLGRRCRTIGSQASCEEIYSYCNQDYLTNQVPLNFEYRSPLLYRPLVEFMHAVPWEEKVRPGEDRHLQRRALRGILPEKIRVRRSKTDADQPYYEGLRTGSAWIEALTRSPRIVEHGFVDADAWSDAVAAARFGQAEALPSFLATATLEIWLRQIEILKRVPERTDQVGVVE